MREQTTVQQPAIRPRKPIAKTTQPGVIGKSSSKGTTRHCCNLKFYPAYWELLEELKKQCGFRSTYEMLLTIVQCFVKHVARRRGEMSQRDDDNPDVTGEIDNMFAAFEDYQPTPSNTTRTVSKHKRQEPQPSTVHADT